MSKKQTSEIDLNWIKSIDGFNISSLFVGRNSDGLYDGYVRMSAGNPGLFGFEYEKNYRYRIFTGIETRPEALRLAEEARKVLFSLVGEQILKWESGQPITIPANLIESS